MWKILVACLTVLVISAVPRVAAQTTDDIALQAAITRQLEALNRDDTAQAFAIASPMIQRMFQDAPTFMRMVREGFPQVYRSRSHKFLRLENSDGQLIQRVLIESAAGTVVARYEMVVIDGIWRINGCSIEKGVDT